MLDELKPAIQYNSSELNELPEEEALLKMLAELKWRNGYVCRKCGHTNYCNGKTPFSRRCTRCKTDESAIAHTIFHRCKIPLREAFAIAAEVCCNPEVSTYELSRKLSKRQMTCWKFKSRIMECMADAEKAQNLKALISGFAVYREA